jgi:LCP family protein required for cell wall assembly
VNRQPVKPAPGQEAQLAAGRQRLAAAAAHSLPRRAASRRALLSRKRLLLPLLFLLAMAGTIGFLWWHAPTTNALTGQPETYGQQLSRATQNLLGRRYSLSRSFPERRQISVLLVGLDHVPEGRGEGEAIRRSDSVLVATTDFSTKQIRLLSIPRDGWVEQYGENGELGCNKLAHSYANGQVAHPGDPLGGINNTQDAVQRLLGIDLDFYVVIQFEGLAKVIDAMGGLEIDVEKRMKYDDNWGHLHINFKPGLQHMTGEQVVQYARFRHDMLGDIARMGRQQKVLRLVLEKAMDPANVARLPRIASLLNDCVTTNLSLDQLLALAQHIDEYSPASLQTSTLQSYGPNDPQYPDHLRGNTYGMAVQAMLPADVQAGRDFLLNLQPPPPPEPETPEGAAGAGIAGGQSAAAAEGTGSADPATGGD